MAEDLAWRKQLSAPVRPKGGVIMRARIVQLGRSDLETPEEQAHRLSVLRDRCKAFGLTAEGVAYDESLAGPSGMRFLLLPEASHSLRDVQRAAEALARARDVVTLEVYWPESRGEAQC